MRGLTRGQNVSCSLTGERSYDRTIGTCYVGDTDLTATIIRQGACARCPRYDPGGRYLPAQREAGAWRGTMPGYCR
jgi:endonuclease YncB( thermonuclease family)